MKQLALSSGITAVCGITEPALYGVNLKLKRPLIASMIGGGVSGLFLGIFGVGRYTTGSPGLLALPGYIGPDGFTNLIYAIIGSAIAFAVSFAATLIMGFEDIPEAAGTQTQSVKRTAVEAELCAPVKGRIIPLKDVKDPIFADEILGKGAAVIPDTGLIVAPAGGVIENVAETSHAVGLRTADGADVLIHIGIDTVKLDGKHFKPLVKAGDHVKIGDPLIEFDMDKVKKAGFDVTTPIIITNSGEFDISVISKDALEKEPFIRLSKKEG